MNKHGIAIWGKQVERQLVSARLHINVWKLDEQRGSRDLDIGIMLNEYSGPCTLNVYIPAAKLGKESFQDLGEILFEKEICSAIFNERLTVSQCTANKYCAVAFDGKDKSENFLIYKLDKNSDLCVKIESDRYGGSLICIALPKIDAHENEQWKCISKIYIRFRISGECADVFFAKDTLANSAMQNFTSVAELFDLRINEIRTLDTSLIEVMNKNGFSPIAFDNIQFFFMCKSTEEVVLATIAQVKARKLESDTWKAYQPSAVARWSLFSPSTWRKRGRLIIAYHWKNSSREENLISDFTMLVKTKFDKLHGLKLVGLIVFALFLGFVGSLAASKFEQRCWPEPKSDTGPTQMSPAQPPAPAPAIPKKTSGRAGG